MFDVNDTAPADHQPRDRGRHPHVVERRGEEAGDDQLPHAQAGEGRALLREDLRSDEGLGVLLRQVQARALQGHHLRALWRRGHALEGAPRAHGPHPARRAGHAHLVLQGCAEPARLPARHRAEDAREGHLLRRAPRHVGRRPSACTRTCRRSRPRCRPRSATSSASASSKLRERDEEYIAELEELEGRDAKKNELERAEKAKNKDFEDIRAPLRRGARLSSSSSGTRSAR